MTVQQARRKKRTLRLFGACALCTVAGCFSLGRPTPPLEAYVLGQGPRATAAAPARDGGGVTIGLRRLDLAPYLSTTAIVVRRGSRIVTSEFRQWGEDPSAGIMRAVALALADAPAILAVDVAPWSVQAQHDYLVQLHIAHLEGVTVGDSTATEGEVRVTASWEILRAQDGTLVARGEADRKETGWKVGDYAGLVTRADKGLTGLASDLAACLGRIVAATPVSPAATPVSPATTPVSPAAAPVAGVAAASPIVVCRAP